MGRKITPPTGLTPFQTALRWRCPACGQGKIFSGTLSVADQCGHCTLPLKKSENADGPIFFVITFFGMLVTALAGFVEYRYTPPLWLHGLLWVPMILLGSIYFLRVFKAMMIAIEVRHRLRGFADE